MLQPDTITLCSNPFPQYPSFAPMTEILDTQDKTRMNAN